MTQEFVVDQPYFMVTYEKVMYPVVITYIFLGRNLCGEPVDPSDPEFFFRYIPAFRYADEDGNMEEDDGPTVFTQRQLTEQTGGLRDLCGLVAELAEDRGRKLSIEINK